MALEQAQAARHAEDLAAVWPGSWLELLRCASTLSLPQCHKQPTDARQLHGDACSTNIQLLTDSFEVFCSAEALASVSGADQKARPGAGSSTCGRAHSE